MPSFVLNNANISARRHSILCLLLLALSLFSTVMATNSMMFSDSNMVSMDVHEMSELPTHEMYSENDPDCISDSTDAYSNFSSDHNHQDCMDNHSSSFSVLPVSYKSDSQYLSSIQTIIKSESYVFTYLDTPYFPPIFIS